MFGRRMLERSRHLGRDRTPGFIEIDRTSNKRWGRPAAAAPMVKSYRVTPNRWNADGSRVGGYPAAAVLS